MNVHYTYTNEENEMGRPLGSKNKRPYPKTRHRNFYWVIVSPEFKRELSHFIGAHNRVYADTVPFIQWERTLEGFVEFLKEIGPIPKALKHKKASLGRVDHSLGYQCGNVRWEDHRINSVKRRGTKHQDAPGDVELRERMK